MPRLDQRLKTVAQQIRSTTHVDVGSDHGHLLKALLAAGRIDRGIAIENKRQPYVHSQMTLADTSADVRFGNGLEPLDPGEADSISICGMGGRVIQGILDEFPDRVPDMVVVQPNKRADLLRLWGSRAGFHLTDEFIADDHGHEVLVFTRNAAADDPAYDGQNRRDAILLGPLHIRRGGPVWEERLRAEHAYLAGLARRESHPQQRLDAIARVLGLS